MSQNVPKCPLQTHRCPNGLVFLPIVHPFPLLSQGHIAELGEVPAYTNFGDQEDSGEEFEDASQEEEEEEEGEEEEREFSADVKKIEESHGELNCSPPGGKSLAF